MKKDPITLFVTGTRGIPDIPGGVETHCRHLYPRIAAAGVQVTLATRRPYVKDLGKTRWQGIHLVHLPAPGLKSLEAVVHTFLAVLKAKTSRADIVHIHAVGPGLLVPFARLLGLKVVVTNHGPDYDRQKWGKPAKFMLRLGEYLGGKFSHKTIAISSVIRDIISRRCGRRACLIPNGVPLPCIPENTDTLEALGLIPGLYILTVSRFVPEKGLDLLMDAFEMLDTEMKLVLAGDADHESAYSLMLKEKAARNKNIVLTGYITGDPLAQVFAHARLFVLPSFHEGLPIALLEAMSYGLQILASDIPAHLEIPLADHCYFRQGSRQDLSCKLERQLAAPMTKTEREVYQKMVAETYNWDRVAEKTLDLYKSLLAP